jgi:hypothetical protein
VSEKALAHIGEGAAKGVDVGDPDGFRRCGAPGDGGREAQPCDEKALDSHALPHCRQLTRIIGAEPASCKILAAAAHCFD